MIGFVDAVKMFYGRYTDFKGRSSRSEFWWPALYQMIVGVILSIPLASSMGKAMEAIANGADPSTVSVFSMASLPYILFGLVNLIPNIAVAVRRFHDKNYTGWLILAVIILSLIPLLGLLVIIGYIVFMCLRGTIGPNKYGDDPVVTKGNDDTPFV